MNWAIQLTEHWRHKKGMVNAFGIILYTDEHPHIKKVLADDDYWAALDKISGQRIAIFSIRTKAGYYEVPRQRPNTLGKLIPVWKEPHENEAIIREFEINSTKSLPQLLIFAMGRNEEILKHSIHLDDSSKENAYQSLRAGIEVIAHALEDVLPENLNSAEDVYSILDRALNIYRSWQIIKKGFSFYKWIKELLP